MSQARSICLPAVVGYLPELAVSSTPPESVLANLKNFARASGGITRPIKNIGLHLQPPVGKADTSSEAMENQLKKMLTAIC